MSAYQRVVSMWLQRAIIYPWHPKTLERYHLYAQKFSLNDILKPFQVSRLETTRFDSIYVLYIYHCAQRKIVVSSFKISRVPDRLIFNNRLF